MALHLPDEEELKRIASAQGMTLSAAEATEYQRFLSGMAPALQLIERLSPGEAPIRYPRTPGYRPEGEENRFNAWACKTTIKGSPDGVLSGKTVAIKDSVFVAGVPLSAGASVLEGFVPDTDATVVTRILDAGGEIRGKSATEYLCMAGNSATGAGGPVENPRAPGRTTGGSSNGSAALLASEEVDLAIGADQAGSIRMPASFTGVVGLKPTFGLVPYTGALSIEFSYDHLGPMARTVADCALLMDVIAGDDGVDGRQNGGVPVQDYSGAVGEDVKGLRVGVVSEGFGRPESEGGSDDVVRDAIDRLRDEGLVAEEVSVPWHLHGAAIWLPLGIEGPYANMTHGHGVGFGHSGDYPLSFMRAIAAWKSHADELAPTIKATLLAGAVMEKHGGRLYAKAMNLRRRLRAEYDAALKTYDVLVMPTTPMTAQPIPDSDASPMEVLTASWCMTGNTCPFDVTGHPAISVPCGVFEGRPVGLQIIGRHFADATLFRLAHAVEATASGAGRG